MEDCFANNKDECFALTRKRCIDCKFYKSKQRAKREYIKSRDSAKCEIDEKIDTYFMSL